MKVWPWIVAIIALLLFVAWTAIAFAPPLCGHGYLLREAGETSVNDPQTAFMRIACPVEIEDCEKYLAADEGLRTAFKQFQADGTLPPELNEDEIPTLPLKSFLFWGYHPKIEGWIYTSPTKHIMLLPGHISIAVDKQGNRYVRDTC